jgi:hypothetical protein
MNADARAGGLDPNIVAALDAVLVPEAGDAALTGRLRRLIENCLADNYDATDVRAVIELAIEGEAPTETHDGA